MDFAAPNIPEQTTRIVEFDLLDENGVALPQASLATATLKLYDAATGVAIGAATRNVLASVNSSGHLKLELLPADSIILNDALAVEVHTALFEWTYPNATPTRRGQFVAALGVINASKVP